MDTLEINIQCKKANDSLVDAWLPAYIAYATNGLKELNSLILKASFEGKYSITVPTDSVESFLYGDGALASKHYSYSHNAEKSKKEGKNMTDIFWTRSFIKPDR